MAKKFGPNIKARKHNKDEARLLTTEEDAAPVALTPRGNYCINPNLLNVKYAKPSCWQGGSCCFRISNTLLSTDPGAGLNPGRMGPDQAELGGMSVWGPAIYVGFCGLNAADAEKLNISNSKSKVSSFITNRSTITTRGSKIKYKTGTYDVQKEGIPFEHQPYSSFYFNCKAAFSSSSFGEGASWPSMWNRLINPADDRMGQAIPMLENKYFIVCHIYELGENIDTDSERYTNQEGQKIEKPRNGIPLGLAENDPLYVLEVSFDAGRKLLDLCKLQKEDWDGDPETNPSGGYVYGDPCGIYNPETGGIDGGNIFTLFNPKVWQPANSKNSSWNGVIPDPKAIGAYEVKVTPSYKSASGKKFSASMTPDEANRIREMNRFGWKEEDEDDSDDGYLLHETSIEEEASLVARGFADIPQILKFAWMEHPEYLQFDEPQSIVKARSTFSMPEEAFEEEEKEPLGDTGAEVPDTTLNTTPDDDDDFDSGEIEAETPDAEDDEDFDELAATFSSDFEEDAETSEEFDPEEEASDIESAMEESMTKATSALAQSENTKRTSPKRKLKRQK